MTHAEVTPVQKVGISACPRCKSTNLYTNEFGVWQCQRCWLISEPYSDKEDARSWKQFWPEHRPCWRPSSGYLGASGVAGIISRSVRWIRQTTKRLGLKPVYQRDDKGIRHACWSLEPQVETLYHQCNQPRATIISYIDGCQFVSSNLAAQETGYTKRWVNELVMREKVSGFISGRTMVHLSELTKYQAKLSYQPDALR